MEQCNKATNMSIPHTETFYALYFNLFVTVCFVYKKYAYIIYFVYDLLISKIF
jgi:hypothetical protein